VFKVIRACLAGGSEEDEANDDRDVPVLSWSLIRLDLLALRFSNVKSVAAARRMFGGHVTVLLE
jgi:hypothetical protein